MKAAKKRQPKPKASVAKVIPFTRPRSLKDRVSAALHKAGDAFANASIYAQDHGGRPDGEQVAYARRLIMAAWDLFVLYESNVRPSGAPEGLVIDRYDVRVHCAHVSVSLRGLHGRLADLENRVAGVGAKPCKVIRLADVRRRVESRRVNVDRRRAL